MTARNRVLETIREVLETLAGPASLGQGLLVALRALLDGLRAKEIALLCDDGPDRPLACRGYVDGRGSTGDPPPQLVEAARPSSVLTRKANTVPTTRLSC